MRESYYCITIPAGLLPEKAGKLIGGILNQEEMRPIPPRSSLGEVELISLGFITGGQLTPDETKSLEGAVDALVGGDNRKRAIRVDFLQPGDSVLGPQGINVRILIDSDAPLETHAAVEQFIENNSDVKVSFPVTHRYASFR